MGTQIAAAKCHPSSWNVFEDVDVFVEKVWSEVERLRRQDEQRGRRGPKAALDAETRRRCLMAMWSVCFCGMQWRAVARMTQLPFGTLFSLFSRWSRRGVWRRLLGDVVRAWRTACGDSPEPSAVAIDRRSCRSAPTAFAHGIDGGKLVKGVKIHLAVDKHGFPVSIRVTAANVHDTVGIRPILEDLAARGFTGVALGDIGYRGASLAEFAEKLGMTVVAKAAGTGKAFLPQEIRWVVERTFAWLSRYRRLNTIFERTEESLIAFIEIACASMLIRRLARLKTAE